MYNDEQNLYHYTYRKDGTEPGQRYDARPSVDDQLNSFQAPPQTPIQEMKPVKKNRTGLKIVALALCCALLGGAVGGVGPVPSPPPGAAGHPAAGPAV